MEKESNDQLDLQKSQNSNKNENSNPSSNDSSQNLKINEYKKDNINIEKTKNDNTNSGNKKDKEIFQINGNKNENSNKEINQNNKYDNDSESLLNYSDLKPLNLVDCIEKKYNLFLPSSKKHYIINQLDLYKSSKTIKCKILEFNDKKGITEKLLQNSSKSKFKCFSIRENHLFAADDQGTIHVLYLDQEYEIFQIPLEQIEKNLKKIQVTTMDVSEKVDYLIIGYSNGFIVFYDIQKKNYFI